MVVHCLLSDVSGVNMAHCSIGVLCVVAIAFDSADQVRVVARALTRAIKS